MVKQLIRVLSGAALMTALSGFAGAATMTMTGTISDSMCGASHAAMEAAHKDKKMTDKDCTLACVKGGAKYVFVSEGKVYNISNQNATGLSKYAGQKVKMTGDMNGENITVTKVAASK